HSGRDRRAALRQRSGASAHRQGAGRYAGHRLGRQHLLGSLRCSAGPRQQRGDLPDIQRRAGGQAALALADVAVRGAIPPPGATENNGEAPTEGMTLTFTLLDALAPSTVRALPKAT